VRLQSATSPAYCLTCRSNFPRGCWQTRNRNRSPKERCYSRQATSPTVAIGSSRACSRSASLRLKVTSGGAIDRTALPAPLWHALIPSAGRVAQHWPVDYPQAPLCPLASGVFFGPATRGGFLRPLVGCGDLDGVPQSLAGRAARVTGETPLAPSAPLTGPFLNRRAATMGERQGRRKRESSRKRGVKGLHWKL